MHVQRNLVDRLASPPQSPSWTLPLATSPPPEGFQSPRPSASASPPPSWALSHCPGWMRRTALSGSVLTAACLGSPRGECIPQITTWKLETNANKWGGTKSCFLTVCLMHSTGGYRSSSFRCLPCFMCSAYSLSPNVRHTRTGTFSSCSLFNHSFADFVCAFL